MNLVLKRVSKTCTPFTYATTDNDFYIQLDKFTLISFKIQELQGKVSVLMEISQRSQ